MGNSRAFSSLGQAQSGSASLLLRGKPAHMQTATNQPREIYRASTESRSSGCCALQVVCARVKRARMRESNVVNWGRSWNTLIPPRERNTNGVGQEWGPWVYWCWCLYTLCALPARWGVVKSTNTVKSTNKQQSGCAVGERGGGRGHSTCCSCGPASKRRTASRRAAAAPGAQYRSSSTCATLAFVLTASRVPALSQHTSNTPPAAS